MHALEIIFQILLVLAPHIGYVAQYIDIVSTDSIEGYAPLVSLILLTSNTLRIYYYIGKHYMLALLFQAILGVVVHFVLLLKVLAVHLSHLVRRQQENVLFGVNEISPSPMDTNINAEDTDGKQAAAVTKENRLPSASPTSTRPDTELTEESDTSSSTGVAGVFFRFLRFVFRVEDGIETSLLRLTPRNFAFDYVVSACVALVGVLLYYTSVGRVWRQAPEVVGYLSLGIEALLVLPQILRNARRRSTEGLSVVLILTWVGGDIIKVVYYIYAKQPLPFIVCGVFQILLDLVVVAQFVYYRFCLNRERESSEGGAATTRRDELSV